MKRNQLAFITAIILSIGLLFGGNNASANNNDNFNDNNDNYNNTNMTRNVSATNDDDNDMDWGWLGLIGLAGLLGRRRKDDRKD